MTNCAARYGGTAALLAALAIVAAGCSAPLVRSGLDPGHAPRTGQGWISLFNGENLDGWRGRTPTGELPGTWKVIDGALVNDKGPDDEGGDIFTNERFDDFEVYYEYCIPRNSNSGIYLRGRYEIQIWDDYGKKPRDADVAKRFNGALYNVAAPSAHVSKPPEQWQSVFARMVGNRVTIVLNGTRIVDSAQVDKPTGGHLDDEVAAPGPIMIQGDHGRIRLRNLYIRRLTQE